MSADDWGPCSACKTPLSRANASRLRSGAVLHVGCRGTNGQPSLEEERAVGLAPQPPAKKERRRISLRDPAAEDLRRGLAAEVARAAAEPKDDVVLQALHVAGGANGIGVGEVRPAEGPFACKECLMPVALCACACASCGGMCGAICEDTTGPGKATKSVFAAALIHSLVEIGLVGQARALLALLPDDPSLRSWREAPAPPVVRTSSRTRPNIDVRPREAEHREEESSVPSEAGPQAQAVAGPEAGVAGPPGGVREEGPQAAPGDPPRGGEAPWTSGRGVEVERRLPNGAVEAAYSIERVVRAAMQAAVELGPDGTEIVALPPLAKAEPDQKPEPVHMLVPGFPGHACCDWPIEAPKPAVPPAKATRARDGKPAVPASPGSPAVPGTPVTTDRPKATCPECQEVYDDAEALAGRIDELKPEPTDDEKDAAEIVEERRAERALAEKRAAAQQELLKDALRMHAARQPGERVHLFDYRGGSLDRVGDRIKTRCNRMVSIPPGAFKPGSEDLETVPFLKGHPSCCEECAASEPFDRSSICRSFGAFVPPDRFAAPPGVRGERRRS